MSEQITDTAIQETAELQTPTGDTVDINTAETSAESKPTSEQPTLKTYTEAELLEKIKEEVQRVSTIQYNEGIKAAAKRAGVDTKDQKKIDEWLTAVETESKAKLTALQRAEQERDEANNLLASLQADMQNQTAKNLALSLDCDPKHVDNVVVLALSRVSDTVTLDAAVNAVMTEIPAFKREAQKAATTPETPPPMYAGNSTDASQTSKLEDILNRLRR